MKFFVYSCEQIQAIAAGDWPAWPVQHLIISVTSPGDPPTRLPDSAIAVLRLAFWDSTVAEPDKTSFTQEQARTILDFVRWPHGAEAIVVQCRMGMSRSHAIAAALERGVYDQDDRWHWERGRPNRKVYDMLLAECAK